MATFSLTETAIASLTTLSNATPKPKDERGMSPLLTAIEVTVTPATYTGVATDRYTVAELTGDMSDYAHTLTDEGVVFKILDTDLIALVKFAKGMSYVTIVIEYDSDIITVLHPDHGRTLATYLQVKGNYPPVAKLFPKDDSEEHSIPAISFDPMKLARLSKVFTEAMVNERPSNRNGAPLTLRFTEQGDRVGPISIARPGPLGVGFRALLQPSTIVS